MSQVINTFSPGIPDLTRTGVSLLAVLVRAPFGDAYAVYYGLVKFSRDHDSDDSAYLQERARLAAEVAGRGVKANYRQAVAYFPSLKEAEYIR